MYALTAFTQTKWEALEPTLKDSSEKARLHFYTIACKDVFVSNRSLSFSYAEKALALSKDNAAYINEYGDMHNMMGIITMYNGQYAKADGLLQKAVEIGRQQNNKALETKALTNLALNSSKKGDYQKSILQNLELVPLYEQKNDAAGLANVYANISNAYYYQQLYTQSEAYQQKALALFQKVNYRYGIGNALNTLSTIAIDQKRYEAAISYAEQSLKLKEELHDSTGIANVNNNLAELYKKLNSPAKQLAVLKKSESIFTALKDENSLAKVYVNFGAYYFKKKNYELSETYDKKALAIAEKTKDPYVLKILYENRALNFARLKNLDTALAYSKKALAEKDSLTDLTVARQIADMEVKYEAEKKERIISEQNNELNKKKLELQDRQYTLSKQRYLITGLSLLLILLAAIAYLSYRKKALQHQQRLQKALLQEREKAAHTVIIAEEKERKRIAQDLHDGVGQMLSAIKMNLTAYEESSLLASDAGKVKLNRILSMVDDSCKEVRSVSHNMMPNALLQKNLASAIKEFIDKLDGNVLQIHLYTEGLDKPLDMNTETVLYRVIQECINNVLKHAAADTVDITVIRDRNEITATIEDNGKGFQNNGNLKNGMGLENMKTRIEYLNGKMTVDSTLGRGTVIAVQVPLQHAVA